MIRNIALFILSSLAYSIQASQTTVKQDCLFKTEQESFDVMHYKNQRQNISFNHHNEFCKKNQELQDKQIHEIKQEIKNLTDIVANSIIEEKNNLLIQFKNEFNVPDNKMNLCYQLIFDLKKINIEQMNKPLNAFHNILIPEQHMSIIKNELEMMSIHPQRITISVATDILQPTFQAPLQKFIIHETYIDILDETDTGIIVLPSSQQYDHLTFTFFCRISAYAIWYNDAIEWKIIPSLLSFFGITQESYLGSKTYQQAIPTFTSHPILYMALTNSTNAHDLVHYLTEYYIPTFSAKSFTLLSKIKMYWDLYSWVTRKEACENYNNIHNTDQQFEHDQNKIKNEIVNSLLNESLEQKDLFDLT